jgi:predicted glycosyltransferase
VDEFEPNPTLLAAHGVDPDDRFCVVRFVGWNAHHDVGEGGFSADGRRRLISRLAEHGQVYITSESPLPAWFDKFRLPVSADVIHDLLYYANVYIGDSQTMATEASVLGTPAIRSNSFAEGSDMSNFRELEQRYDLLFSTSDEIEATEQAVRWFRNPHSKSKWNQKRRALIEDKINVTQFVIELVDNEVTKEVVVA